MRPLLRLNRHRHQLTTIDRATVANLFSNPSIGQNLSGYTMTVQLCGMVDTFPSLKAQTAR